MSFQYFPFGRPVSSSHAVSASFALTVQSPPLTASFADHDVNSVGPTGPTYVTVNGIITTTVVSTTTTTTTQAPQSATGSNGQIFDFVGPNMTLTRRYWGGLYNSELELSWDVDAYTSPSGTLWNSIYTDAVNYGWGDLSNVTTRTYDTFNNSLDGAVGNNAVSTDLVMHDTINNKYYKFDITEWGNGMSSAPYAYNRQEINTTTNTLSGSIIYISRPSASLPTTMSFEINVTPVDPVFI